MEGNIDILLNALISIVYIKKTRSLGAKFSDIISNIFGFIMLLVLCYAPFHALFRAWQLHRHQKKKFTNIAERIVL